MPGKTRKNQGICLDITTVIIVGILGTQTDNTKLYQRSASVPTKTEEKTRVEILNYNIYIYYI